jgi:hypothetical protein
MQSEAVPVHARKEHKEVEVQIHSILTSSVKASGPLHAPAAFLRRQRPGTHSAEGRVEPRAGLDALENSKLSCPNRESKHDSSVVQSSLSLVTRLNTLSQQPVKVDNSIPSKTPKAIRGHYKPRLWLFCLYRCVSGFISINNSVYSSCMTS